MFGVFFVVDLYNLFFYIFDFFVLFGDDVFGYDSRFEVCFLFCYGFD